MSLFDLDDDALSSSSDCGDAVADAVSSINGAMCRSGSESNQVDVHRSLARSVRNMLTVEQARAAEARRRQGQLGFGFAAVEKKVPVLSATPSDFTTPCDSFKVTMGKTSSAYGDSIASALQLRRDEKEKVLLRRLRKRRREEGGDSLLVEKDLEIGVFVTAAYRKILEKHDGSGRAAEQRTLLMQNAVKNEADDEDEPLDAYIRKLEAVSAPSSAVNTELCEASVKDSSSILYHATISAQECRPSYENITAQMQTVTPILRVTAPVTVRTLGGEAVADGLTVKDTSKDRDIQAEHARALYNAREAARGRRVDAAIVSAAAARCSERVLRSIRLV